MRRRLRLINVSNEAVNSLGGVGVATRALLNTKTAREHFDEIILAGPLLFPEEGDCRTAENLHVLQTLKSKLADETYNLMYPPQRGGTTLPTALCSSFKRIEEHYDLRLYFAEGQKHRPEPSLLLIDQSSCFGQNFMTSSFVDQYVYSLNSELPRERHLHELKVHPRRMRLGDYVFEALFNSRDRDLPKELTKIMLQRVAHIPEYTDYDYNVGVLMAAPLAQAIVDHYDSDPEPKTTIVTTNDYLGIPTLYELTRRRGDRDIRTAFYASEIRPVRHIVEALMPDPTTDRAQLDESTKKRTDPRWTSPGDGARTKFRKVPFGEHRLRLLEDSIKEKGLVETFNHIAKHELTFGLRGITSPELQLELRKLFADNFSIGDQAPVKVFGLLNKIDILLATSTRVAEQLDSVNKGCCVKRTKIVPHGLYQPCVPDVQPHFLKKIAKEEVFKWLVDPNCKGVDPKAGRMRHGIGGMNYDHVFLKIARPVRCKCFDRDVSVCTELNRRLSDSGQRALFLVVSSWDDQQRENEIWNWFRLLYDRRNDLSNIDFYVINDFNWPGKSLEERNKLRSKLFWACDVSFSQSSYESFGIAQLEPLAFGSICIISAVSGAAEILHQHLGSELYQNHPSIVLADYTGDNNPVGDNIRKIAVNVFKYDTAELEHQTAVGVATEVWRQLEAQKMDEQIDERWKAGADAAAAFDEEKFAREFVRVVTSTDQQDERPEYQSATEPSNDDAEAA